MARKRAKTSATPGQRVGTKRRDMRWLAPDGTEWDSKFEYEVFLAYTAAGRAVRKCGPADSVRYSRPVRNAVCLECASGKVASGHSYTPDLHIGDEDGGERPAVRPDGSEGYLLECKGYLRAERRSLLRALCKERPDLPLRFIVQRDYPISKHSTIRQWIAKYLKKPVAIWTGTPPRWEDRNSGSIPTWV